MSQARKRCCPSIAILLALAVTACVVGCVPTPNEGSVTLVNESDECIVEAQVEVAGQVIQFHDIGSNEQRHGRFDVRRESDYQVEATLSSGQVVDGRVGYVTRGFDTSCTIAVTNTGVFATEADFD